MSSRSILLIEHEDNLRDVLDNCLTELGGWEVTPSGSIREGIKLREKIDPT
jgi:DNA-binding NtrC family response regulator